MFRPAKRQIRVVIGVVTNLMPFSNDAPDQPRIAFRIHAHQEKRGFDIRRLQDVQDLWGPFRIRTVIKCKRDLVFTTSALMIKGGKLRELQIIRSEVTLLINIQLSLPIRPVFVNRHDFSVADICDRLSSFQDLDRLSGLVIHLELGRNVQRIPDRGVFGA